MPDNGRQGTPVFPRMASEMKKEIQLEVGHVLFIDDLQRNLYWFIQGVSRL
jgi:hypothetical protein